MLGYLIALPLRDHYGYSAVWGAFGLTAASALAGWIELALLARWLSARIGKLPFPTRLTLGAFAVSLLAGAAGYATWLYVHRYAAIPVFGALYLGIMMIARVPELSAITRRLRR